VIPLLGGISQYWCCFDDTKVWWNDNKWFDSSFCCWKACFYVYLGKSIHQIWKKKNNSFYCQYRNWYCLVILKEPCVSVQAWQTQKLHVKARKSKATYFGANPMQIFPALVNRADHTHILADHFSWNYTWEEKMQIFISLKISTSARNLRDMQEKNNEIKCNQCKITSSCPLYHHFFCTEYWTTN
jgi:hypothetical protein